MHDWLCERCGDAILPQAPCRCATPYDPVAVRRRHRDAVRLARSTDRRRAAMRRAGQRPAA